MSNIKTKQPFQLPSQQQNRVGQTWETRKAFLAQGGGRAAPTARQAPQKHVDQFLKGGKKPETVGQFDPQAMYRKARMHFMGAPSRPAAVEHLQNGTAPKTVGRQWTDDENLHFLQRVSDTPVYATKRSIQKAAAAAKTVNKPAAAGVAQQTPTAQHYAQALAKKGSVPSK
jgi:hypothetical protein